MASINRRSAIYDAISGARKISIKHRDKALSNSIIALRNKALKTIVGIIGVVALEM